VFLIVFIAQRPSDKVFKGTLISPFGAPPEPLAARRVLTISV
jgi:hypothetical protein